MYVTHRHGWSGPHNSSLGHSAPSRIHAPTTADATHEAMRRIRHRRADRYLNYLSYRNELALLNAMNLPRV